MARKRRVHLAGAGSSGVEALAGSGAVVLAILGLLGTAPQVMAGTCAVLVGSALLFEGGAVSAHYGEATRELEVAGRKGLVGGAVSAEVVAGVTAIVLGAVALAGVVPLVMVHVAALVLGLGLLLGGALVSGTYEVRGDPWESPPERRTAQAAAGAGTAEIMIGGGAIVLAVLALIGIGRPLVLTLVAYLGLGAGVLGGGLAMAGRLGMLARHERTHEPPPPAARA